MDEKKIREERQDGYAEEQKPCGPDQKEHEIDRQYQEDPVREQKTEDTLREMAEDVEIPQTLTPEAVEAALKEQKRKRRMEKMRKSGWKYLAAAACFCLAVGVPAGYQILNKNGASRSGALTTEGSSAALSSEHTDKAGEQGAGSESSAENRIVSAKDYDEIYDCMESVREYQDSMTESMSDGTAESGYDASFGMGSAPSAGTAKSGNTVSYSGVEDAASQSDTNVREEGVGEGDIVKTDGDNLYILNGQKIDIVSAGAGELNSLAEITMEESVLVTELYVENGRLVVVYSRSEYEEAASSDSEDTGEEAGGDEAAKDIAVIGSGYYRDYTCADVYDVSSPAEPVFLGGISQSGYYNTMRAKDGYVYLLSNYYADIGAAREDVSAYIPEVQDQMIDASDIYMPDGGMGELIFADKGELWTRYPLPGAFAAYRRLV